MSKYCKELTEQNRQLNKHVKELQEKYRMYFEVLKKLHHDRKDPRKRLSPSVSFYEYDQ